MILGAKEFTVEEFDALFQDDSELVSPPAETTSTEPATTSAEKPAEEPADTTKAFAKRLKESTDKVRIEEREALAKSLGYTSYEELQKQREAAVLKEKGLDPELVKPVVDELVKKRIEEDPRMQELSKLRETQIKEFGKRELAEITKLTDGEITSFDQLPKDVVELWKSKGSLKAAYLELKGEELLIKVKSNANKGDTKHLATPNGVSSMSTNKRSLTAEERQSWKFFNPSMTEEELNKIEVKKE